MTAVRNKRSEMIHGSRNMISPFGNPLVPLEKIRYANVSLLAGRTASLWMRLTLTSCIISLRLFLPEAFPSSTYILEWGRPTLLAVRKTNGRNFDWTNKRVTSDRRRACSSSNGVEYDESSAKGTTIARRALINVMYSCDRAVSLLVLIAEVEYQPHSCR